MRESRRRARSPLLAVTGLAMAAALSGCGSSGSGPSADGPLSSGTSLHAPVPRGSVCLDAHLGQAIAFGFEEFTNYGHIAVVLSRVALNHPHNERLIGSYAIPGYLGLGDGYWPLRSTQDVANPSLWKLRQPVHGFRLGPGKTVNMILGVKATAAGHATSRGMTIYYHNSAGSYVTSDGYAMGIAVGKASC
jgi:hypothetical protein